MISLSKSNNGKTLSRKANSNWTSLIMSDDLIRQASEPVANSASLKPPRWSTWDQITSARDGIHPQPKKVEATTIEADFYYKEERFLGMVNHYQNTV